MLLVKMFNWLTLFLLVVLVAAKPKEEKGQCPSKCVGEEYECIGGDCYCADGFIPNYFQTTCVKCPELSEQCFSTCCNSISNESLQCWHGICQSCYDDAHGWNCRDTVDQFLLISTTQVIMGTALILGIIATLMLLFKLCTMSTLRPLGNRSNSSNRLSVGSLQMYVDERLRDAPPRYSGVTPAYITAAVSPIAYNNECFIPDGSIPPPPYTEELKNENNQNTTVHI